MKKILTNFKYKKTLMNLTMNKLRCYLTPQQKSIIKVATISMQTVCNWMVENFTTNHDFIYFGKSFHVFNDLYFVNLNHDDLNIATAISTAFQDCRRTYAIKHKKEILTQLKDLVSIDPFNINKLNGNYIPFLNGYYYIPDHKFISTNDILNNKDNLDYNHDNVFDFKSLNCTYAIPHNYNPDANCDKFITMINKIFTYKGKVNFHHRDLFLIYFAYCLTDSIKYQKILILYGMGANGKSVLVSIMQRVLGSKLTTNIALQDVGDIFNRIQFMNKLLNVADDIPSTALTEKVESILKIMSGTENMQGQFKGVDPIDFKITCKHVATCNCIPAAPEGADFAFFRRWIVLPLLYTFKKDEINLEELDKIFTEESMEGIIQYILTFLPRLDELRDYSARESENNWRKYGDSISSFMYFHVREHEYNAMPTREVYQIYMRYCKLNNLKIANNIQFGKKTTKRGISKDKRRANMYDYEKKCFNGLSPNPIWHCVNFQLEFNRQEAEALDIIRTEKDTWRIRQPNEKWYYSDLKMKSNIITPFEDFKHLPGNNISTYEELNMTEEQMQEVEAEINA
jgi:putative DNA primase/helicase